MKAIILVIFICASFKVSAQNTDTVKCYVQIMVPAADAFSLNKHIDKNMVFVNGGLFLYTKAYAVKDTSGKYVKFLTPRRKELTDIWKPNDQPQVMIHNW